MDQPSPSPCKMPQRSFPKPRLLHGFLVTGLLTVSAFAAPPVGKPVTADLPKPVTADSTIRGKALGSEIVITTTTRCAGAIHSLTWNGREFINSADHGRQLQSASNLDCATPITAETYNPTEAGSARDGTGPASSSKLLSLKASGNVLETSSQMAFWLAPGEKSGGQDAKNTTVLSNHLLRKRVQIGSDGIENLIRYDVTFTLPKDEKHTHAVFEALTGYMPWDFQKFWTLNPDGTLEPIDAGPGEQTRPLVFSTPDSKFAMGIYSPDQPSKGFEAAGYGRFAFDWAKVVKWNCVFRVGDAAGVKPGEYSYRMYVAVGTLEDVRTVLVKARGAVTPPAASKPAGETPAAKNPDSK